MGLALAAVIAVVTIILAGELARIATAKLVKLPVERRWLFVTVRRGVRWQRLVTLAGGSVGAYLGVVLLAFVIYACHGVYAPSGPLIVRDVVAGTPAAGTLDDGDAIVAVDGIAVGEVAAINSIVDHANGAPVMLTIERGGARRDATVTPIQREGRWIVGMRLQHESVWDSRLRTAIPEALAFPVTQLRTNMQLLESDADPGGPVRIVMEFQAAEIPNWIWLLRIAALLACYGLVLAALVDVVRLGLAARN